MMYKELAVGAEIGLKEKPHEECRQHKIVRYRVVAKYSKMCMVEDQKGKRRGVAIGELIMNNIITQEPCFESMRKAAVKDKQPGGWHKRNAGQAAEHAIKDLGGAGSEKTNRT